MKKEITLMAIGVLMSGSLAFAEPAALNAHEGHEHAAKAVATEAKEVVEQVAGEVVVVNNKICPVSGHEIGSMGEGVKHVYNGKEYTLCCGMCKGEFDADPDKFAKIAEDEVAVKQ